MQKETWTLSSSLGAKFQGWKLQVVKHLRFPQAPGLKMSRGWCLAFCLNNVVEMLLVYHVQLHASRLGHSIIRSYYLYALKPSWCGLRTSPAVQKHEHMHQEINDIIGSQVCSPAMRYQVSTAGSPR